MHSRVRAVVFTVVAGSGLLIHAQTAPKSPPLPVTRFAVGQWDAAIVRRAADILASSAQWNKADTGDCEAGAKTLSISCALDRANQEAAGVSQSTAGCRFHSAGAAQEGSCGALLDRVAIFTIAPAPAITTGRWRQDATPRQVWAGAMTDAASPIFYEAEKLVRERTTKKYDDLLVDYNNDPATTFADVRSFFPALEALVTKNAAADMENSRGAVDIEIEIYDGGTGLIRTNVGWFPIAGFTAESGSPRFEIDLTAEVPPNALDRKIIERAAALIASDAVWNRHDNRKCPAGAPTVSLYCAEEQATIEVTGAFHHRRPALEIVRVIVDDRTKDKNYQHRLMDYNNDPTTTLADVKSLFAEALARIK